MIFSQVFVFIILSFITLASVIIIMYGAATKSEDTLTGIGLLIFLITMIFGWGIIGLGPTYRVSYEKIVPDKIIKSINAVYVSCGKRDYKITDIRSYNVICDTTKFYFKKEYCLYNFSMENPTVVIDTSHN